MSHPTPKTPGIVSVRRPLESLVRRGGAAGCHLLELACFLLLALTASTALAAISLQSVAVAPSTLIGGRDTGTGTVTLTGKPSGKAAVVTLKSSIPAASVPSSVTVPSGATSQTFPITATAVTSTQSGTITATYSGVSKTAAITVRPVALQGLALGAASVIGPNPVTGTVTLECPAPSGGAAVALASSDPAAAKPTVSSVTIPAGASSAAFSVSTSAVTAPHTATITAQAGGVTKSASLTVHPPPSAPPVADDQSVTTLEDTPGSLSLTARDPDGDPLTYAIVSAPAHGALSGTPPNLTYTPAPDYFGSDSFTFRANDGKVNSNTATVGVTVQPVNDAPVADAGPNRMAPAGNMPVLLPGSRSRDVDGDPLTYSWTLVSSPAGSAATLSDPAAVSPSFVPDRLGDYVVRLVVNDGSGDSEPVTAIVTAEGYWMNVRLAPYQASGDGFVNDRPAIQAAIEDVALTGGCVYLPAGNYRIDTQLIGRSYVEIAGDGQNLTTIAADDVLVDGVEAPCVWYSASHSGSLLLADDVAAGTRSVLLAAGGGNRYRPGATIYLQDSQSNGSGYNGAFTTTVQSVSGDLVTLAEDSPYDFRTSLSARAYYYTAPAAILEGAAVRHLTLQVASAGTPVNRTSLLRLDRCRGAVIEDVRAFYPASAAARYSTSIVLVGCRDCTVQGCTLDQTGGQGDGVNVQTSTACRVVGCQFRYCSFSVVVLHSPYPEVLNNTTFGRHPSLTGRGVKLAFGTAFGLVEGNSISDVAYTAIYLSDSWGNTVRSNQTFRNGGAEIANPSLQHAILVGGETPDRSHHNTITGNQITSPSGYGIAFVPNGSAATPLANLVSGNTITGSTNGIYLGASQNRILDNTLQSYGQGGTGVYGVPSSTQNTIRGNTFSNGRSGRAIDTGSSAGMNSIGPNTLNREAVRYHPTDLIY